jgi:Tol biopolymer transport system component
MNKRVSIISMFLLAAICSTLIAQNNSHPYSSKKPIPVPIVFAEGIISVPGVFGSTFTPDGKTFYFAKYDTVARKSTIMKSTFMDDRWSTPVVAEFSGEYGEGDPFISPDGSKMFFWSIRPTDGTSKRAKRPNIWMCEKTTNGFGNPTFLGNKLKVRIAGAPTISSKGTLYFFTANIKDTTKSNDIYKADIFSTDSIIVTRLSDTINSGEREFDSYIAPDESYIIFSRNEPPGKSDLYISYNKNGVWSTPVNLDAQINSPGSEFCPIISPDGNYLFFTSDRSGQSLIYQVDKGVLPKPVNAE